MTFRANHPDELISASLTGDLTDAERAELDAHLARCDRCRATLAAFKTERRILSGLPIAYPPRDLSARVRSGIESGRLGAPWWRRRGGLVALVASGTTVAAAVVAILVLSNFQPPPVGQATSSPEATLSSAPSSSQTQSAAPSVEPTDPPLFALGPGELGYLELSGAPFGALRLTLINDATGASMDLGTVSGPPIAASLSPDGEWLAYITVKGETGANEVWALHLTDANVIPLGCSVAAPFTDRLAWSPFSNFLGYTLTAVDLGPNSGCPPNDAKAGTTSPWLFEPFSGGYTSRVDLAGDAYAAPMLGTDLGLFMFSLAGAMPTTVAGCWFCDGPPVQVGNDVFMPLVSPDGNRALFWAGTMASSGSGWQFSLGGMPQISGDFRSTGPASPWVGTPLFTDLTPVGGAAFAYGKFVWGPDSDLIAFWDGDWTGAPQSADGNYPSAGLYVGRASQLLSAASALPLDLPEGAWIVDVVFAPDGASVVVTIGLASAGIGDPPASLLFRYPLDGGDPIPIAHGGVEQSWGGPAIFGR